MDEVANYSILVVKGESLKDSPLAEKLIALDRKNMEATLGAVGLDFPESRRRINLFHPSNRIIIAEVEQEAVGYVDYCDDLVDPHAVYLSSIQIEAAHRGGPLFKLLLSTLLTHLRARTFRIVKTHIQRSNLRMIAIAKRLGFTLEENPKNPATLTAFAERKMLDSPKLVRLLGSK